MLQNKLFWRGGEPAFPFCRLESLQKTNQSKLRLCLLHRLLAFGQERNAAETMALNKKSCCPRLREGILPQLPARVECRTDAGQIGNPVRAQPGAGLGPHRLLPAAPQVPSEPSRLGEGRGKRAPAPPEAEPFLGHRLVLVQGCPPAVIPVAFPLGTEHTSGVG